MSAVYAARFEPNFEAWRSVARRAYASGLSPDHVVWEPMGTAQTGLFARPDVPDDGLRPLTVPRRTIRLLQNAVAFDASDRWDVAYRALCHVAERGEAALNDVAIPSIRTVAARDRAVRRDVHKMHAFVRFQQRTDAEGEHWVSWHRPDHHIIRLAAPHFVRRFGDMRFALLTPKGSAIHVPGAGLSWAPAASAQPPQSPDELDALWCTYYANIYNPVRTLLKAMRAEMPLKHWATMPETRLIPSLLADAPRRLAEAAARAPAGPSDLLPPSDAPLDAVHAAVRGCAACPLAGPATQAVCGEGPVGADIVLVGEQPGDLEDRTGRPFVGPAGEMLGHTLHQVGLQRDRLYLTNAVKHFRHTKRGKRRLHERPERWHVERCVPFLHAELSRVRPRVVVALGATAARALLGKAASLSRLYGTPHRGHGGVRVRVAPHPAAILRQSNAEHLSRELVAALEQAKKDRRLDEQ